MSGLEHHTLARYSPTVVVSVLITPQDERTQEPPIPPNEAYGLQGVKNSSQRKQMVGLWTPMSYPAFFAERIKSL